MLDNEFNFITVSLNSVSTIFATCINLAPHAAHIYKIEKVKRRKRGETEKKKKSPETSFQICIFLVRFATQITRIVCRLSKELCSPSSEPTNLRHKYISGVTQAATRTSKCLIHHYGGFTSQVSSSPMTSFEVWEGVGSR